MTENDFKKMNDYQLVSIIKNSDPDNQTYEYNLASKVLFERYERQLHKNWWKLRAQMNGSQLIENLKEEYYSEAQEAFWVAIQKINLDKVRDDNWKCVGWIDFYLRNVRTKLIKDTKLNSKSKSITSMKEDEGDDGSLIVDPDVEIAYWESEGFRREPSYAYETMESVGNCENAVAMCKAGWSNYKNEIFDYLQEGKTKTEIAKIMNENPMKIYQVTTSMKKDMKKALGV